MQAADNNVILPEFFESLASLTQIDEVDWKIVCKYAERWKLSIADSLLDLKFVDEVVLAKALSKAKNLMFLSGAELRSDFTGIDFETFQDLLATGAVPLEENRLAICNPYDDLHGNLGYTLCQREWVVTERSAIFNTLRQKGLNEWFEGNKA